MFDHVFRLLKDRWLELPARAVGTAISPDAVSVLACLIGLLAAWQASLAHHDVALVCWLLNRTLDGFPTA